VKFADVGGGNRNNGDVLVDKVMVVDNVMVDVKMNMVMRDDVIDVVVVDMQVEVVGTQSTWWRCSTWDGEPAIQLSFVENERFFLFFLFLNLFFVFCFLGSRATPPRESNSFAREFFSHARSSADTLPRDQPD
jgi:hypothetical protein